MSDSTFYIIYFDGECHFCNQWVVSILKADTQRKFSFAPIQGVTARNRLPVELFANNDSLVLEYEGEFFTEARAVSAIAARLPYPWKILALFKFLPFSRLLYRLIATNRYRISDKITNCPLPNDSDRFLT